MKSTGSWLKHKGERKGSLTTSIGRLNSSLGEYLVAIKALSNTLEGTTKSR